MIPSLYRLGYNTINYYYSIRWLAAKNGYGSKPSSVASYFMSQGFSIKKIQSIIRSEAGKLSRLKRISLIYSYPEYLVRDLLKHLSEKELERILESLNTRKRWLRINLLKTSIEKALDCLDDTGVLYERHDYLDYLLYVKEPKWRPIGRNKCVLKGYVVSQDVSSVLTIEAMKPFRKTLLDACSAPGLKLSLIHMFRDKIFSLGIDSSKKRILSEYRLLNKLGVDMDKILLVHSSSLDIVFNKSFEQALVDAPCSGLGAVYSDPAVKINTSKRSKLNHYHMKQYRLLKNILKYSDIVVYVTCSIHPLEGEAVIEKIVRENLAEPIEIDKPYLSKAYPGYTVSDTTYRINPYIVKGQGFYIAFLKSKVY